MAKYLFEIQHVDRAFSGKVPERLWHTLSRHTSLEAARKRLNKKRAEMRRICGPGAWNGHYRIIALEDVPMAYTFHCQGTSIDHYQGNDCEGALKVRVTWQAGHTAPAPEPGHWPEATMCPACRRHSDAEEAQEREVCCG